MLNRLFNLFTNRPKRRAQAFRPQLESLEVREVLSGNVAVTEVSDDLVISGDNGASHVEVFQIDADSFRVRTVGSGLNGVYPPWWNPNGAVETTIHGITDDIRIHMGGGNDKVYLGRSTGRVTASPDDTVISMDSGNDLLFIERADAGDDFWIYGGNGSDSAYIYDAEAGTRTSHGAMALNGFDHTVDVRFTSTDRNLEVNSGHTGSNEAMYVYMYGLDVGDALDVNTGGGNDYVKVLNSQVGDFVEVDLGGGNDGGWVGGVVAGTDLRFHGGSGSDSATVVGGAIGFDTFINGFDDVLVDFANLGRDLRITTGYTGTASASVIVQGTDVGDDMKIETNSGRDVIRVEDTHVGDVTEIYSGNEPWWLFGGDQITLSNSSSGGLLYVSAGDGNDHLTLTNYTARVGSLYGGAGYNYLNMDAGSSFPRGFTNAF